MELVAYYDSLYKRAKGFDQVRLILLYISLLALILSLRGHGLFVYLSSVFVLLCQSLAWYYQWRAKRYRELAHDFHVVAMLHDAYGKIDSQFNVANLIAKLPRRVFIEAHKRKKTEAYNTGRTANADKKLLRMIQENSYWNNHLYRVAYLFRLRLIIGAIIVFVIAVFVSSSIINFARNLILLQAFLLILSFSVFYELFESTLIYNKSSEEMAIIDNEISRLYESTSQHSVKLFSKYSEILLTTPDISDRYYDKNKDRLNEGWLQRLKRMEGIL